MARGRSNPAALEMEDPTMFRLQFRHPSSAQASIGSLSLTAAAVQDGLDRTSLGPIPPRAGHAGHWLDEALDTLLLWHDRARQRHQLLELSDHMLHDLALSRVDAVHEARKPFWRG
jgi:uncharacterized protein YjiS (DUF1127 family)